MALFDGYTGLVTDDAGNSLAAATVTVYNAIDPDPLSGSNTLAVIYSDREGVTEIDQTGDPLQSGSKGKFTFYVVGGFYHILVEIGGQTSAIPDVAIGTAGSLDTQDIGGGDSVMIGEVRIFVGAIPDGWERLATAPLKLQDFSLGIGKGLGLSFKNSKSQQFDEAAGRLYTTQVTTDDLILSLVQPQPIGITSTEILSEMEDRHMTMALSIDKTKLFASFGLNYRAQFFFVDTTTGVSTQVATHPGPISNMINGSIVEVSTGTYAIASRINASLYIYDEATNTWSASAFRPGDIVAGTIVVINADEVIVLGGYDNNASQSVNASHKYTISTDSWVTVTSPVWSGSDNLMRGEVPSPKVYPNGNVYIPGPANKLLVYNVITDSFAIEDLIGSPTPDRFFTYAYYADEYFVLSSRSSGYNFTEYVYLRDPATFGQAQAFYAKFVGV